MTDNSAEREAEEILKAAAEEIQAEKCPAGRDCGVHFRVDESIVDEDDEYARFITYSGDYVVVTEDNHEWNNALLIVRLAFSSEITREDLPNRWETSIFWVGSGSIADLTRAPEEVRRGSLRYSVTHDDFSHLKGVHDTTVSALQAEMIDVSKSIGMED